MASYESLTFFALAAFITVFSFLRFDTLSRESWGQQEWIAGPTRWFTSTPAYLRGASAYALCNLAVFALLVAAMLLPGVQDVFAGFLGLSIDELKKSAAAQDGNAASLLNSLAATATSVATLLTVSLHTLPSARKVEKRIRVWIQQNVAHAPTKITLLADNLLNQRLHTERSELRREAIRDYGFHRAAGNSSNDRNPTRHFEMAYLLTALRHWARRDAGIGAVSGRNQTILNDIERYLKSQHTTAADTPRTDEGTDASATDKQGDSATSNADNRQETALDCARESLYRLVATAAEGSSFTAKSREEKLATFGFSLDAETRGFDGWSLVIVYALTFLVAYALCLVLWWLMEARLLEFHLDEKLGVSRPTTAVIFAVISFRIGLLHVAAIGSALWLRGRAASALRANTRLHETRFDVRRRSWSHDHGIPLWLLEFASGWVFGSLVVLLSSVVGFFPWWPGNAPENWLGWSALLALCLGFPAAAAAVSFYRLSMRETSRLWAGCVQGAVTWAATLLTVLFVLGTGPLLSGLGFDKDHGGTPSINLRNHVIEELQRDIQQLEGNSDSAESPGDSSLEGVTALLAHLG